MEEIKTLTLKTITLKTITLPGEPNSPGHLTITHQMLASIFQVSCIIFLPNLNKDGRKLLARLLPYLVTLILIYLAM